MTTDHHPITPPDELVWKWHLEWWQLKVKYIGINEYMATQAARWGDEQRLEACCEWVADHISTPEAVELRAAMRPKPPSLKEQA